MSIIDNEQEIDYNSEGKPLRIHTLDIEALALHLHEKKIRTSQGKVIQPLHAGHLKVIADPARYKVLAAGRRWGKCAGLDESVVLADGSVCTMKDLLGKNFELYSYDSNNRLVKTEAVCVDNGTKPVFKIKTKYGLEMIRTGNHPLYTGEGWKTVDDGLSVGNRIFVPSTLPQEGTEVKNSNHIELLALLLGDGGLTQKTYSFTVANPIIKSRFLSLLDGTCRIVESKPGLFNIFPHRNNSIYKLIEDLGLDGKNSHTKFIPNWVYTSPNHQIALFLNRLFSTDGWITDCEIGYCSASKVLVEGVKRLLARLGITSLLETKTLRSGNYSGNVYFQLKIQNYSEIKKFIESVGILGKEDKYPKALAHVKNSFNTQVDTLPKEFCYSFSKKLQQLISFPEQEKTGIGRIRSDRACGRQRLIQYCNMFPEHFKEERRVIEMRGYWDEITDISYLGEKPTAGISVPTYHNYVNDCLEHNTLITSLIALSVLFQPRRRVWIVAPDYSLCEKVFRELYTILVHQLKVIKPNKPNGGRARNQRGEYYLETPWGSVLEAKSLENTDSLAGEALDLVIIDEAALDSKIYDVWSQMLKPTLMDKSGSAIFISTPRGRNGFYKLFLMGQKGLKQRSGELDIMLDEKLGIDDDMTEWSSFRQTSYDNPLLAATPELSKLEVDKSYREAVNNGKVVQFKQEYLADFEAVSDMCFPGLITEADETNEYPNVVDYKFHPDEGPVFAACDFNFAKPASTIFAQVNKFNDVIIFDEFFTQKTTPLMQGQQIKNKQDDLTRLAYKIWEQEAKPGHLFREVKIRDIVADISGKQVQLTGRTAWDDVKASFGKHPVGLKQDRETGSNMIRQWLQFPEFDSYGRPIIFENGLQKTVPKLFVSRNCPNVIYALTTAKFQKSKNGGLKEDYEETPEGYEGLIDALRYLLVYLFHDRNDHFTIVDGF